MLLSMKRFLIITFALFTVPLAAQSPIFRINYSQQISNYSYEGQHITALDGGTVMLYQGADLNSTTSCLTVIKTHPDGHVEWCTRFNIASGWSGNIVQSKDSSYFFCATIVVGNDVYYFMVRLSSSGNVIFQKHLAAPAGYYLGGMPAYSVAKSGGGYYFFTEVAITASNKWWNLVSINDTGAVVWSKLYNGYNKHTVRGIDTCSNGDIIMLGSQPVNNTIANIITRVTQTGALVWSREFLPSVAALARDICSDSSGNIIVVSSYLHNTSAVSRAKAVVTKISPAGTVLWSVYCGTQNGHFSPTSCVIGPDNSITVAGIDSLNTVVMTMDSSGIISWGRQFPACNPLSIDVTPGTGYSLFALSYPVHHALLITMDSWGAGCNDSAVAIQKTPVTWTYNSLNTTSTLPLTPVVIPGEPFQLSVPINTECMLVGLTEAPTAVHFSAYPVPASDHVEIVASGMIDELVILDLQGRCVMRSSPGATRISVDVSILPAGVYVARIQCGDKTGTLKIPVQH